MNLFVVGVSSGLLATAGANAQEWRPHQFFFGRGGHDVAFDPSRGVHVLLGGRSIQGLQDGSGLWEWNGTRWDRRLAARGLSEREDHALCFDENRLEVVVFGGIDPGTRVPLGDTWSWNGIAAQQLNSPIQPPPRGGHRMVFQSTMGQAVLFGGVGVGGSYLGDTWIWNGATWRQVISSPAPSPRIAYGMAYDRRNGRIMLFGGADAQGTVLNDTWAFDGTVWIPNPALGPSARHGMGMDFDPVLDSVVLYGGGDRVPATDLWAWDRASTSWQQRSAGSPAGRRYRPCVNGGSGSLLLFGGVDTMSGVPTGIMDVWSWNGATWTPVWQEQHPLRRSRSVMAHDAARGRTVLYGGWAGAAPAASVTWEWNGEVWQSFVTGPGPRIAAQGTWDSTRGLFLVLGGAADGFGGTVLADLWGWDGGTWRLLDAGVGMESRYQGAMAYDSRRGCAVVFGGSNSAFPGYASGTLEWTGAAWRRPSVALEPPERIDHAMVFDPRRGKVVLFGGLRLHSPTTLYSDTWEWDGIQWTQMAPATVPPPRRGHALVYDSTAERVLLYGGDQFISGTNLRDCWAYDGSTWTALPVAGAAPVGRAFHNCVHDTGRDRLLIHGGLTTGVFTPDLDQWELLPNPRLSAPAELSAGGPVTLQVRGQPQSLFLLALAERSAPGIPFLQTALGFSRQLPLANDRLFRISLGFGLVGSTGTGGVGSAVLATPADPNLAGLRFYSAGVVWEPANGWQITEEERTLVTR